MYLRVVVFFLLCFSLWGKESSIAIVGKISHELERLQSPILSKLVEKEIGSLLSLQDGDKKHSALKALLDEIQRLTIKKQAVSKKPILNGAFDAKKEAALCNYLVQQACLLEALEGKGVGAIKSELTGNFNDHGLSPEGKRLTRRLVALCEEAERSYKNVSYVKADGTQAKASLMTQGVGVGVGASLLFGDVSPLISSAIRIGRGYSSINRDESRKLALLIQAHEMRITNFLFNVNTWRNDLVAEKGIKVDTFITPSNYREFLKILAMRDLRAKQLRLQEIMKKNPAFTLSRFYLAETFFDQKNWSAASRLFTEVTEQRAMLLHKDGFISQAYTRLAEINVINKKSIAALKFARAALKEGPNNASALHLKGLAELQMGEFSTAEADVLAAHRFEGDNANYCWSLCKIYSASSKEALSWLEKAIDRGFNDFEQVREWKPLASDLKSWKGRSLINPRIYGNYKAGIFKDDVVLVNASSFDLERVKYSFVVDYVKKGKWVKFSSRGEKDLWSRNDKLPFKDIFSMKKTGQCIVTVTFTSKQNPTEVKSVTVYNSKTKKSVPFWESKSDKAWAAYHAPYDETLLTAALKDAEEGSEASFHQNAYALSVWAHIRFKLGDKKGAVSKHKEAVALLVAQYGERAYKQKDNCKFYRDALAKFENAK